MNPKTRFLQEILSERVVPTDVSSLPFGISRGLP